MPENDLACARATASGECILCQAVAYQTHLLLQYTKGKRLHPCAGFLMGWGSVGFGFTWHVSGVCRGYCLWRLHPLPGWGIPDWIR